MKPSGDHRCLVPDPVAFKKLEVLGPVVVVSLVGAQRAGKSTLMNLLHSRTTSGFRIGHFMDPQTHGLWVWPRPHPFRPGVTVLFVDVEGLDSPHVAPHYQWLVAAVTLMISDVFMYQTQGSIEQSSADRLGMILKVAEHLGKVGDAKPAKRSGAFLWLVRDHHLQMQGTPKGELDRTLDPTQLDVLRRNFDEYDCVPLPRPAAEEQLRNLECCQFEDLCPDFVEEYVVFERRLFQTLSEPRTFLGSQLDGLALAEVLSQYLDTIDRRPAVLADIFQIPSKGEILKQLGGKRAVEAGVRRYEEMLAKLGLRGAPEKSPASPAEIMASHASARCAALESFDQEVEHACLGEAGKGLARQRLEERLACWGTRVQLAGAADLEGGPHSAAEEEAAPMIVRVDELRGGLLKDVWSEHARRTHAAFEAWLGRALVPTPVLDDDPADPCSAEARDTLESYYSQVEGALTGTERDSSKLGPWAAGLHSSVGGELGRQLLLGVTKNSNAIVLRLAKEAAAREHVKSTVAFKAEIQRMEALVFATNAELKDRMALCEQRSRECAVTQANASVKEGLNATKELAAKGLKDLEETTMRIKTKSEGRLAEQKQRLGDLERQLLQLRGEQQSMQATHDERVFGVVSRVEKAEEALRASREELSDKLEAGRSVVENFAHRDGQRAEQMCHFDTVLAELNASLKECTLAAESRAELLRSEVSQLRAVQSCTGDRLTELAQDVTDKVDAFGRELSRRSAACEATLDGSVCQLRDEVDVLKSRAGISAIWESFAHLSLEVNNLQVEVREMAVPRASTGYTWRR